MRTAFIVILLFLTYSLLYLTSPSQKEITSKSLGFDKNVKIKSITGIKNIKPKSLKIYKIEDVHKSLRYTYRQIYFTVLEQFNFHRKLFLGGTLFIALLSTTTLFFVKGKFSSITAFVNNFVFCLGDTILVILSLLSIGNWIFLKQNIWKDIGLLIFAVPFGFLIISSIAIKIYDFNYPIWNKLFKSFLVPIISGIIITLVV